MRTLDPKDPFIFPVTRVGMDEGRIEEEGEIGEAAVAAAVVAVRVGEAEVERAGNGDIDEGEGKGESITEKEKVVQDIIDK